MLELHLGSKVHAPRASLYLIVNCLTLPLVCISLTTTIPTQQSQVTFVMLFLVTWAALAALVASATSRAARPTFSAAEILRPVDNVEHIGSRSQRGRHPLLEPIPETAGLDFDINNFASDKLWAEYIAKGNHLNCIMDATDAGAGFLVGDKRKPPSAASPWSGDLRSRYSSL
jgi:hypothetical protein